LKLKAEEPDEKRDELLHGARVKLELHGKPELHLRNLRGPADIPPLGVMGKDTSTHGYIVVCGGVPPSCSVRLFLSDYFLLSGFSALSFVLLYLFAFLSVL
jgi:hypothetical protein